MQTPTHNIRYVQIQAFWNVQYLAFHFLLAYEYILKVVHITWHETLLFQLRGKKWLCFSCRCTVPVIWNWKNRCILGVFVTQKFYLHELWNLHVIRMCPKASLTNRLWEIRNSSTQSWDIVILRKQDWSIFAQFSAFYLEIEQKCLNLAFLK